MRLKGQDSKALSVKIRTYTDKNLIKVVPCQMVITLINIKIHMAL